MQVLLGSLATEWGNWLFGGALGSLLISMWYNWRQGLQLNGVHKDLRTQADNLLTLNNHLMNAFEQAGWVKWNRTSDGSIKGRILELAAEDRITFEDSACGVLSDAP